MELYVQEEYVNQTENCIHGSTDVYETYHTTRGDLFRAMQKEYGRCQSTMYVGDGQPVGWVFLKRVRYTDTDETYLQETWVSVHTRPPTRTIEYHYA